ncbi:NAD-dependent epimerase/dehydratase family protein [Prochlorococcus marinus]|uniref:NAD-dependent epimerase/dehydratase family protein n=1 Tax=Prochlorococcus marinus TaxID=1219 RepID=UPI0022B49303|nr:NAD-dependent epimerase/dehydratase family protein [Prochlorococcus marinus]
MKTLVMGGTRFVGKAIVQKLILKGYDITLFTRGLNPLPSKVTHIKGDRKTEDLEQLKGNRFDVIIDTSGRSREETEKVIANTGHPSHRFIYLSSAGIYKDTEKWPLQENSPIDPNSRHIGKAKTEEWLSSSNIPFTIFRPTYIYGAGNYNPIEKWFFDRIIHSRPIPLPLEANTITQLGHVSDLAEAIVSSLENNSSLNKIYNCSNSEGITFIGLINICAIACGKDPNELIFKVFDPSGLNKKERKIFPVRLNHFLTDISLIKKDLDWEPRVSIEEGLADFYRNDYCLNKESNPDFSLDDILN